MGKPTAKRPDASDPALTHDEANALLYAYAHVSLEGRSPADVYPQVAAHLATCARCRADLAELHAVVYEAADPEGAPIVPAHGPNLSRLPRPWREELAGKRPWFTDRIGRIWLELSAELLRNWRPAPLLGMARGDLLYSYADPPAPTGALSLAVEIAAEDDPTIAHVSITVSSPAHPALDQSGIGVTLHFDDASRTTATDTAGCAEFPAIPRAALDHLRIEIRVDQSA